MTAPTYTLRDRLPVIDVEAQAGREITISVPVLGAGGGGVDVAGLVHVRAQVRLRWDSDLVLHAWDDVLGNATLEGTPGGTDAAAVVTATDAETTIWGMSWPRLAVFWDIEVEDTGGEIHPLCTASPFALLPEITRPT